MHPCRPVPGLLLALNRSLGAALPEKVPQLEPMSGRTRVDLFPVLTAQNTTDEGFEVTGVASSRFWGQECRVSAGLGSLHRLGTSLLLVEL